MRVERARIVLGLLLVAAGACGDSGEGESCDPANGNSDCDSGLVCTPAHRVKATEPVCCPRAPAAPSVDPCQPELGTDGLPDPSIDASFAVGGRGAGGTSGVSDASGESGSSGAPDSAPDSADGDGSPDTPDSAGGG